MNICRSTDFVLINNFLKETFSSPSHWPDWNLIISKHYNTNFFYFVAIEKNRIIGICPVHKVNKGIVRNLQSGQFHYIPYGGWIFRNDITINSSCFNLRYDESISGFSLPTIKSFPKQYKTKNEGRIFTTLYIDLENDEDWLWQNTVDSKRRNMIRKARKNNISTEQVSEYNFDDFFKFYSSANKRYGLQSLEFDCLYDLFFSTTNINFRAAFVRYENQIISSSVIVSDKDYALYWLGLNGHDIPNLGQGELLQWEAILFAKNKGCKVYDLCYIEKDRLPSIYEFKKGFSQEEASITNFSITPLSYKIINRLTK